MYTQVKTTTKTQTSYLSNMCSNLHFVVHFFNVFLSFLKVYFTDYTIIVVPIFFSPLFLSALYPPPTSIPPISSCPWLVYISSLASTFPILFLPSPCLFCTYHFCFLFPVPFPPILSTPPPH